jgi:hypothetical protein
MPGGWVVGAVHGTGELLTLRRVGSTLATCRPHVNLPGSPQVVHLFVDPVAKLLSAVTAEGKVVAVPWSA